MKAGGRKRDPHPLSQARAARRRQVHRSTIVGLSRVCNLAILNFFSAVVSRICTVDPEQHDTTSSACFAMFFPCKECVLHGPLLFSAPPRLAQKKGSLRKFQISHKNQCVDSNRPVCTVILNLPESSKNRASLMLADWKRMPGRKGGPMT